MLVKFSGLPPRLQSLRHLLQASRPIAPSLRRTACLRMVAQSGPTMEDAENLLRTHFKYPNFRHGQRRAIQLLLSNAPTDDIPAAQTGRALAIFPTGAGKSLCYQLPGLLFPEGLTLVVSPLMALMKDQVDSLVAKGFSAACLDSSLTAGDTRDLFDRVRAHDVKILFVSPERFKNERFIRLIRAVKVALFAVDEAHCISEWGHSFRPDYLRLSRWADRLSVQRRLALTATATPRVAEDICHALGIPFPAAQVRTLSVRSNLTTRVTHVPSSGLGKPLEGTIAARVDILAARLRERPPGPAIVYVTLQATATLVAEMLRKRGFIQAASYHAGMRQEERKMTQDNFMANKKDALVVATIAFGMGMDHSGIRYVYHLNMPKSLESYIQEIGRAGRDGLPSVCESLVCIDDVPTLEGFAYGETPAKSSVLGLVRDLFEQAEVGGYIEYSTYDLCTKHDIRDTSMSQLLAQLDLSERAIEESTPFFAIIDCKMLPRERRKFPPAGTDAARLVGVSDVRKTIMEIDVMSAAKHLQLGYGKISRIVDDMVNDGYLESCKSRKLMHRARVLNVPDSLEAVAVRLHAMLLSSQKKNLNRLRDVLNFYGAKQCQTVYLATHLGDELEDSGPCGHCEFCLNDQKQPVKLVEEFQARGEMEIDERRWALIQMEEKLPRDNPLMIARFAAGIWSPGMGRGVKNISTFGSMSDHDFPVLLKEAEKACGVKSE